MFLKFLYSLALFKNCYNPRQDEQVLVFEGLVDNKLSYDDQGFYDMSKVSSNTTEDLVRNGENKMRLSASEGGGFVSEECLEKLKKMHSNHSPLVTEGDGKAQKSYSEEQAAATGKTLKSILDGKEKTTRPFHGYGETEEKFCDRTRQCNFVKVTPRPGDVDLPNSECQLTYQEQLGGVPTQTFASV